MMKKRKRSKKKEEENSSNKPKNLHPESYPVTKGYGMKQLRSIKFTEIWDQSFYRKMILMKLIQSAILVFKQQ